MTVRLVAPVVVLLAVLLVPVAAWAAWSTTGPGTTSARAGTLTTPTVTQSAVTCQQLKQRATFSWAAITGATTYDVDVSTTGSFPGTVTRQTARSVTVTAGDLLTGGLTGATYSVRVRAVAGQWTGSWSATSSVKLATCLA